VDVRVDRERRDAERLAQDDARGLAADAGELDELLERARDLPAVLRDELLRQPDQRLRLRGREADLADERAHLLDRQLRHRRGRARAREQGRRDLVHLLVRRLRREDDRDEQGERIDVVERDRDVGDALVEDLPDARELLGLLHRGGSIAPPAAATIPRPKRRTIPCCCRSCSRS
jgi:hypothetical protein